ncbi:hypothetical protein UlMin_013060 [Ulmus minor]
MSSNTTSPSPIQRRWICRDFKPDRARGFVFGHNPFLYETTVLYMQLSLSALLTAFFQLLLNPLGESAFISQLLAGIILGPSVFGTDNVFAMTVFPQTSFYISQTFAFFGCMIFMFLVGVKMDFSLIINSGRRAVAIGLCCFFGPLLLNLSIAIVLQRSVQMDPILEKTIVSIAVFQSTSSFHVTACLLADLKLLNSELGRLAVSSSMISGTMSWVWLILAFTVRQSSFGKENNLPWMALSLGCMLFLIIFVLRPIALWMVRTTLKGRPVKDNHINSIFLMVLFCALVGEFIGQHFMLGPMILGLAIPDGPPLGSALVDKLDSYVSSILLPSYFVFSGATIDIHSVQLKSVGIIWLLVISSFLGKVIGAMVPSLCFKTPVVDALTLGLIVSAQGITDILLWQHGMMLRLLDRNSYSIMVISTIIMTGTITPLVKFLYQPSKRYASNRRRTLEHALPETELRVLACIYQQENTPSIIRLLELSNPTQKSPICFYAVHLIQLTGRSSPLLISYKPGKKNASHSTHSDHIINAFQLFERQNPGRVIMNAITAMAPCATMHDDICTLALEKRTCMVIIPFHKQLARHGADEGHSITNPIRSVNHNILRNSPCSVGILVDRGTMSVNASLSSRTMYTIGMIFIEGPDDREALAYAIRMAEHPNVNLTVVRLLDSSKPPRQSNTTSMLLDLDLLDKFKAVVKLNKRKSGYKEKSVKNGVEMINVIRSMESSYDLILVGRRHSNESPLFTGLTDWNEYPELGFIGDMLASADTNCHVSLLVVQQQSYEGQYIPGSPKYVVMHNVVSVHVDIPKDHPAKSRTGTPELSVISKAK